MHSPTQIPPFPLFLCCGVPVSQCLIPLILFLTTLTPCGCALCPYVAEKGVHATGLNTGCLFSLLVPLPLKYHRAAYTRKTLCSHKWNPSTPSLINILYLRHKKSLLSLNIFSPKPYNLQWQQKPDFNFHPTLSSPAAKHQSAASNYINCLNNFFPYHLPPSPLLFVLFSPVKQHTSCLILRNDWIVLAKRTF